MLIRVVSDFQISVERRADLPRPAQAVDQLGAWVRGGGFDGTGLELNEHRVCSRRACLIHPRTSLSKLGSDRPLAQALHVPRITVISPICDTIRVRTTCPGIMFRRVAVSAATSVWLRIRNQLARPGP